MSDGFVLVRLLLVAKGRTGKFFRMYQQFCRLLSGGLLANRLPVGRFAIQGPLAKIGSEARALRRIFQATFEGFTNARFRAGNAK